MIRPILEDKAMPEKTVKVKVVDRWSVAHDGKRYVKGQTLTVPEATAKEWEQSGWVERVASGSTKEK
jgi:hypothetical protein